MPKSPLALKAPITHATPVPSDLKERLQQLQHHQQSEQADEPEPAAGAQSTGPETPAQDKKRDPHGLQGAFLAANLNWPVTVYLVNSVKLTGRLQQFDQFTLLLSGDAGSNLVYKHAIATIQPAKAAVFS